MKDGYVSDAPSHLAWPWVGGAVLLGIPLVIVMPLLALTVTVALGCVGLVLLVLHRHEDLGLRTVAMSAGLMVPASLYLALAMLQR